MSTATVMQAYRFALDPSAAQARDLERHAGAARFAFNWALAQVKANIGQRTAERSYGVDGEDLTASLGWNLPALRRAWNAAKSEIAPWWSECSKEAFNPANWPAAWRPGPLESCPRRRPLVLRVHRRSRPPRECSGTT
jgi:transposase